MTVRPRDALVVVDVQNDFCPGGALPVPAGHDVVEVINWLMSHFGHVLATQDFHPSGHSSFKSEGGPWPEHCVKGTKGAEFHPGLDTSKLADVVQKGTDQATDGYSGFAGTDLAERLRGRGVDRVFVAGLATDYCVLQTTLEAIGNGFDAVVVTDAVAAVDVEEGDGQRALDQMRDAGATLITSSEVDS